jgi:uncharacterized protein (TIGR03084 family)
MATDLQPLLDDVRAEQADLRALVESADLDAPTPAEGWDVRDAISHLSGTDHEATVAATDPDRFVAGLQEVAKDIEGFLTGQLVEFRELPREQVLQRWQERFDRMLAAFAEVPPGTKVPWYGPPMSPASFATARLMEYWAHGQDVADALGVRRPPTGRLRHICHLGVRTRDFAHVNRGLAPPDVPIEVQLTAPDGSTWSYGDAGADQRVTGTAEDFCLLVTQRRHRDDTALEAIGDQASRWLDVAQAFAGPPGPGRAPGAGS